MDHGPFVPVVIIGRLQRKFRLRVSEWLTAIMFVCWGVELAACPRMFDARFFSGFLRVAPQPTWSATLMVIGFARLSMLAVNGSWRYSSHARAALLIFSVWVWIGVVFGILASDRPTLGAVVYPVLMFADVYAATRAGRDARVADEDAHTIVGSTL